MKFLKKKGARISLVAAVSLSIAPRSGPRPSSHISLYFLKSFRYLPSPAFSSSSFGINFRAAELRQ